MKSVASICRGSRQRGNALVLLLLLKTWDGAEAPDHYELADLAHISPRQAERDLLKLVADGEVERLSPEHNGGRGHKTRWQMKGKDSILTPSAQTPSYLSESDKTPTDVTDFKGKETAPQVTGIIETTTDVTGLSDVNRDKSDVVTAINPVTSDGTGVAPLEAETITQQNEEANASSAQGAVSLKTYIGRLIQFRESELGTKLPAHKIEAAAAKWLFEQRWEFDDVLECYHFLVGQGRKWRGKGVTLKDVMGAIADWKKGNLDDGTRNQPQRNGKPSRSEVTRNRDYSWASGRDGGGGGDVGADSRPLSDFDGLATPVRR